MRKRPPRKPKYYLLEAKAITPTEIDFTFAFDEDSANAYLKNSYNKDPNQIIQVFQDIAHISENDFSHSVLDVMESIVYKKFNELIDPYYSHWY